ncbi:heme-degrading domain-containing protein [Aureimonas fodinaquatilis]|uniref:UPF0303 protein FPY71_02425 n=1 Tax=Aureimonas fodinaquatilis TaxID=2565783 RepID=A0A5B0E046_9HYPH|nr:heme-degrading domain-containing protein [Aureimonas fodinaquatilis]KAA0971998.1 heme-degrading domain-containing protein [Aureimonas fodinaquatilis]
MDVARDIRIIKEQESRLAFATFNEKEAFKLGSLIREKAISEGLGIVIDIRTWDRPLFYSATAGSTGSNPEWARRKSNLVRRFHKSSYRVVLELAREDKTFPQNWALDQAEYALAGGGFPLTIGDVGVIGSIAVSGLPEREDHQLITRSLAEHLMVPVDCLSKK